MSTEINSVIEELGQAFESFKSANDDRIKALEKKTTDSVATDQVERLTGIMTSLNAKLDQLRQEAKIKAISDRPVLGEGARSADIERKAFSEYLRTGNSQLLQEIEKKYLNHNEDSGNAFMHDGKISLPSLLQQDSEEIIHTLCPVMKLAKRIESPRGMRSNHLLINPSTYTPFQGEESKNRWKNTPLSEKSFKFDSIEIEKHHFAITEKITPELIDSANSPLIQIFSACVGHMLNQAFFYGTGEDEPKGMIIADMFADAGTEGKFLNIKTGFEKKLLKDFVEMESDGTNFGKYTNENIERSTKFIDSILEMKHSIAPEFRDSLDIMAHSTAIAQMMKVRIGKEYAYSSVDRTFLGIKVYDNNVMPAFVKNEAKEDKVPSLLMANYKEFYAYIFGSIDCWVNTKTADGIPQITMQYVAGGTPIDTRACAGLTCAE